jgi:hypothetical protein
MNKYANYGTVVVLAHGLVATAHGLAHKHLAIDLTFTQKLFVLSVITVAPLVSMLLLWTRLRKAGAALLLLSMAGSLIFGVINHFVIASADHVLHLPVGDWRFPFQITAIVLFITECFGCWIGAAALRAKESV